MGFLVVEDETSRLPVALLPLAAELHRVIRGSRAVAVAGRARAVVSLAARR